MGFAEDLFYQMSEKHSCDLNFASKETPHGTNNDVNVERKLE